jgi:hypothetical protein
MPRPAVEVAKKEDAPPATGAVPLSAVTLPVTATVAPVTLPVTLPIKPFVDVTGPEKVVDAMIVPYIQVGAH